MGQTNWNLPSVPGFEPLSSEKPITFYVRHLPHWRQVGATYFVTFRQVDSLSQEKLSELRELRQQWDLKHPLPQSELKWQQLAFETMRRAERWLDQGIGGCRLRDWVASKYVADALHYFDGGRYELGCYVVMPNHVHAIVRPFEGASDSLERILKSWKGYCANRINQQFRLSGAFWQEESFDRIIRDEEHLYKAIQYIGANPLKAGLKIEAVRRWVRPAWADLGYGFEDE